jgi:glucokinase
MFRFHDEAFIKYDEAFIKKSVAAFHRFVIEADMIRIVMMEYTIGLDLGGTNLRAAAFDQHGGMIDKVSGRTNLSEGREAVVADMVRAIRSLRDQLGAAGLNGIGAAVPGFIDLEKGVIINSNNLSALEGFPIRDRLEENLETSVLLENDANAAALGERWMGAGRGVDDLVLLTLGTGIGGGIICGGKVLHGHMGMAAELGHITVVPNGNPCGCGNRGCVEKHASAQAVSVMARLSGLGDITSEECFHLAEDGNEKAQAVFAAMGESLGIALAMLVNTFNFPLYLIGGGALGAWAQFAPPMLAEVRRRSLTFRATRTRIEQATLGGEAGLYGAAYLPRMTPASVRA